MFRHKYIPRGIQTFQRHFSAGSKNELSLSNEKLQKYLDSLREEFYQLRASAPTSAAFERMKTLNGVVTVVEQSMALRSNMVNIADIEKEKDEDMRQLMQEENEVYSDLLKKTEKEIMRQLLTLPDDDFFPSLIFEVNAGAGGQEAMLFAKELLDMYCNYFNYNGWEYEVIEEDDTEIGGIRHANIHVYSPDAYSNLRYEAGVHRVQRVPTTDKSGRVHTSTASITVIPRPPDVNVSIAEKDLKIETKRASGAGGQHVNTTDSAVRIVHLPSGLAVESQSERSQIKNREIALKRLQSKLLQQQLENIDANTKATKRAQQGNLNRNEKIRTYNFVQDRITDHRIEDGTVHNLEGFLEGSAHLDNLIQRVVLDYRKANLTEIISNWQEDSLPVLSSKKSK